ncbi:MAG: protein tyrosine phosphatase family protein [Leptolyngbyaceae cyanobacterium]
MLEDIYHYRSIAATLATAGQPTAEQFATIQDAGFSMVINLAPPTPSKTLPHERLIVEKQGMTYIAIPAEWQAPAVSDFARFQSILSEYADTKIFVHCVANMRVSVFVYLHQRLSKVSQTEAEQHLFAIWTPNEIWQAFIQKVIQHYSKSD